MGEQKKDAVGFYGSLLTKTVDLKNKLGLAGGRRFVLVIAYCWMIAEKHAEMHWGVIASGAAVVVGYVACQTWQDIASKGKSSTSTPE